MKLDRGTLVSLRAFNSQVIERIVISSTDTHVNVCLSKEWDAAKVERREPACVGFHKSDVIQTNEVK